MVTYKQSYTNYKLPASSPAVALLPDAGWDMDAWGKPGRALIDALYEDTEFIGGVKGQGGLTGSASDLILRPVFRNCRFTVVNTPDGKGVAKWAAIPYGMADALFENCLFENAPKEHLFYAHGLSGAIFRNCIFRNAVAQGVQVSERSAHHGGYETFSPKFYTRPAEILFEDCLIANCGRPPGAGRAGFAATFFSPESDDPAFPVLSDISAVSVRFLRTNIRHRDSESGAFTARKRPLVILDDSSFDYRNTGNDGGDPLTFINRCLDVRLVDWHAPRGKVDVLDNPPGKLLLARVSGQAMLRLGKTGSTGKVTWTKAGTLDSIGSAVI